MKTKRVDCRKCRHFKITWDKKRPYGCKAHGFKTAVIPSQEVLASSGMHCLLFAPKQDSGGKKRPGGGSIIDREI